MDNYVMGMAFFFLFSSAVPKQNYARFCNNIFY